MDDIKDEIIKDCLNLLHNVRVNMTEEEYSRLIEICKRTKEVYENVKTNSTNSPYRTN